MTVLNKVIASSDPDGRPTSTKRHRKGAPATVICKTNRRQIVFDVLRNQGPARCAACTGAFV